MLNPTMYFSHNKRRGLMIVAILATATFCLSFVAGLVHSVGATGMDANTSALRSFSLVKFGGPDMDQGPSVLAALPDVGDILPAEVTNTSITTILGTVSTWIVLIGNQSDLSEIVSKSGLQVDPALVASVGDHQLLLHADIVKNKKMSVGDQMGTFTLAGIFTGDAKLGVGLVSPDELTSSWTNDGAWFVVFPTGDGLDALNTSLDTLPDGNWTVESLSTMTVEINKDMASINEILTLVMVMIALCVAIATAALVYTVYSGRYDEFAILNAIGYGKPQVRTLIAEETAIVAVISWIIGYGLSLVGLVIVNVSVYAGMGQSMPIVVPQGLLYTLFIPVLVVLFGVVPVLHTLSRTDLVSVIERR